MLGKEVFPFNGRMASRAELRSLVVSNRKEAARVLSEQMVALHNGNSTPLNAVLKLRSEWRPYGERREMFGKVENA